MERDRARLMALETTPSRGPSLTLYRWAEPTITLGYAQREERVLDGEAVKAAGLPVIRRPTGGRAILHIDEWTYAAVVPIDHPRLGGELRRSLAALSSIVAEGLAAVGVEAWPVPDRMQGRPSPGEAEEACFTRTVGYELSFQGRKLAGAAQRRLASALLQQGTILVGAGHERLAGYLAGDERAKRRGTERLRESTVTVGEILGERPDYDRFARELGAAWARALRAP